MSEVIIKGRPKHISREEARAWIHATLCVLAYHNLRPVVPVLHYRFKKKLNNNDDWGIAFRDGGCVEIKAELLDQEMFTTIVHETIHLCVPFPQGRVESCTSTLCARIKKDVSDIAFALVEGTYKRAAAIAHCKISYGPKVGKEDFYNGQEDEFVCWAGDQYRGKKKRGRKKL